MNSTTDSPDKPLMFDAIAKEQALTQWRSDNPPTPGHYLVSMWLDVFDDGNRTGIVDTGRWDGKAWDVGGYVTVDGWMEKPEPVLPQRQEETQGRTSAGSSASSSGER